MKTQPEAWNPKSKEKEQKEKLKMRPEPWTLKSKEEEKNMKMQIDTWSPKSKAKEPIVSDLEPKKQREGPGLFFFIYPREPPACCFATFSQGGSVS